MHKEKYVFSFYMKYQKTTTKTVEIGSAYPLAMSMYGYTEIYDDLYDFENPSQEEEEKW